MTENIDVIGKLDELLKYANDADQEHEVMVTLMRRGWITEDGRIGKDLKPLVDPAAIEAFGEPF